MSSSSKNKIKGALAASLTAFKKDLSLDIKLTIKHGQDLLDQGLDGVVFFGTTGEGNSINIQEKKQFIDTLANEKFENDTSKLFNDLRNSFVFKETKFAGVYAYSFEKEAVSTEIQLTGPAYIKNN